MLFNNYYFSAIAPKIICAIILLSIVSSCTKAVAPTYKFRDGFLLVDGRLSNINKNSYLSLKRATLEGRRFILQDIEAQQVSLVSGSGEITNWIYNNEQFNYYLPENFTPETGQEYLINITDEEGFTFESQAEIMPESIPLEQLDVVFSQESYYSDTRQRFVPAFELFVDFTDPGNTQDFYRLNYSSWQSEDICLSCYYGFYDIFSGDCVDGGRGTGVPRFDYSCDTSCWLQNRYPDINLFSDEFNNGNHIQQLKAGQIDYDFSGRLLIVAELERVTPAAFEYSRVLLTQGIDNNGLNATLPASLDGNLDPVVEGEGLVLGYFNVGASSEQRYFFNRDTVQGSPIPFDNALNYDVPPFPEFPYEAPCDGPGRSAIRPTGWE